MSTLKKHQHYVWQYYLKPWTTDNKINCLRKGKNFNTSLKNIAQERFFYRVEELGVNEIRFFKNLIENSIKYNESDRAEIVIRYETEAEQNYIFVQDNGIGIEKKYSENIFQMFSRLHTHQEYEGSGLGLAICKKIVDEFEGSISFESEIGVGTQFKIEIPNSLLISDKKLAKANMSMV